MGGTLIGLDTNVLLRLLVPDDEIQTEAATSFLNTGREKGEKFFIPDIVLCELVWVLRKVYRQSRAELIVTMQFVLGGLDYVFESDQRILRAFEIFRRGKGDFADCLLAERCFEAGCDRVATFDKGLLKGKGFIGVKK